MKLAISNIAWEQKQDEIVYGLMQKYGYTGLEDLRRIKKLTLISQDSDLFEIGERRYCNREARVIEMIANTI